MLSGSPMRLITRLLGSLALGLSSVAFGASTRAQGGTVYVNELQVLTLRSGSSISRAERAQWIANRVKPLGRDSQITVKKAGSSVQIVSASYVVMNVIRAEATAHGSSQVSLGEAWAANLRKALAVPPLQVENEFVKLPPGGAITIPIKGSEADKAKVTVEGGTAVVARRTSAGIRIDAKEVGECELVVTSPSATVRVLAKVAPYAADFPQSVAATVTGDPATIETVHGAIEGAIQSQTRSMPGTSLAYSLPPVNSLPFETSMTIPVRVRATGEDVFDSEGIVNVVVRNLPLGFRPESELWYCNEPENVKGPGSLFAASLKRADPARILYHHINESPGGLYINIEMSNLSDKEAKIVIIPGDSRPDKNPVLAGYVAADQFLRGWAKSSGQVITLPPRTSLPLAFRRLAPKETMSGLAYLRLIEGPDDILVTARAIHPFEMDDPQLVNIQSTTPWRYLTPRLVRIDVPTQSQLTHHIYPKPFKLEEINYSFGKGHGFVRIGQRPIERADRLSYLSGNFGVVYTINARLDNPTDEPVTVEAVFEASAGYSGALFLVNGEIKRLRLIQPKEEAQIMVTRVAPRAFQEVRLVTVPLSGSSYPATVTFRPTATQPRNGGK